MTHFPEGKEMESYGDDGAYSFLIESNSIKRFNLCFTITQSELNNLEVSEPWQLSSFSIDDDWRRLG